MPTNTDGVQGAVCGTCGQPPCQCGDARLGVHHTEAWYADHDFTLPAPVVPSDERRQCWEVFSTTAIGASVIKWHCKLEKGHDGDHMGAQIHAAAPPTHSQDAEGYGLAERIAGPHGIARCWVWRYPIRKTWHEVEVPEAVESAIRAPYEELVKAAREVDANRATDYEIAHFGDESLLHTGQAVALKKLRTALESLGGCS